MKKLNQTFAIFIIVMLTNILTCQAQNMSDFFKYEGVKLAAELAHPTGTFTRGTYQVYDSYVLITANYADGNRISMKITRQNNYFTSIRVQHDTDGFPAFLGLFFIKQILLEAINEGDSNKNHRIKSQFERYLDKQLKNFSGYDCAILALTLAWFAY